LFSHSHGSRLKLEVLDGLSRYLFAFELPVEAASLVTTRDREFMDGFEQDRDSPEGLRGLLSHFLRQPDRP
jgi:hypothetical protein